MEIKTVSSKMLPALAILLPLLAGPVAAVQAAPMPAADVLDAKVDYSADFYVKSDKGTYSGKVYHSAGKDRREFATSGGGQVLLLRRDTNNAYMLTPHQRFYVGMTYQQVSALVGDIEAMDIERTSMGDDTVAGVPTTRYEVSGTSPQGGRFVGDMWFTQDGILMKALGTVTFNGKETPVETGLRNLRRGHIDPMQFELPADYKGLPLQGLNLNFDKLGGGIPGLPRR